MFALLSICSLNKKQAVEKYKITIIIIATLVLTFFQKVSINDAILNSFS